MLSSQSLMIVSVKLSSSTRMEFNGSRTSTTGELEHDFSLFHTGLHQMHIQNYTLSTGCLKKELRELLHWERTVLSTGHILGNPMQDLRHEIL